MEMCQQKLQAGHDIDEGLTAQKYTNEIVRPHVEPHVDNHALSKCGVGQTSYSKDKSGRPCLYDQHPVVTQEPRY